MRPGRTNSWWSNFLHDVVISEEWVENFCMSKESFHVLCFHVLLFHMYIFKIACKMFFSSIMTFMFTFVFLISPESYPIYGNAL